MVVTRNPAVEQYNLSEDSLYERGESQSHTGTERGVSLPPALSGGDQVIVMDDEVTRFTAKLLTELGGAYKSEGK